ncbi:putative GTPase, G3E family [Desulfosporosinus orientis DSM 765]|uniref:Putative GTPase, G3E family n=1 Tax=Desulfosporosinus orientis (strain ATCC 19365 / DSM 765 / NCIMB 8382 / VKM B-1628 / Singapore I) TaxID=768706 RepID=G7WDL4_DESOD|nr:CobW family GTP-binding protein [Desulfosporosinus orientis]AET68339.1 putative GTPase, G3E family [Desulfosporosinus orientis DSM 765]
MVKFDIVSGFLGAGKTTLVKKILHSLDTCEKIVLIENDFGEVNVDREILEFEGFEVYELSNGCVCCKLKGDFLYTLKQLLNQKIDRIIFEPSGIFIFGEILDVFRDPEIADKCTINSVITVIDALNFADNIQSHSAFFKSQILNASSLVISKAQFLDDKNLDPIVQELQLLNEKAPVLSKDWAKLTAQDTKALINRTSEFPLTFPSHFPDHNFDSVGLKTSKIISFSQLEGILEICKTGALGKVMRGKGILNSGSAFLEFNYVEGQYSIEETTDTQIGIVSFIGNGLKKEALTSFFALDN